MKRHLALLAMLMLLTTACGETADTTTGPPEIVYGRDLCVECGMLITEDRFAAAYRVDGEVKRFDDIGGMLLHGTDTGDLPMAADDAWVHDLVSRAWVAAPAAWYVVVAGLATPMGYDIVAFADRSAAEAFTDERTGMIYDWSELIGFSIEDGKLVHQHGTEHEGAGS